MVVWVFGVFLIMIFVGLCIVLSVCRIKVVDMGDVGLVCGDLMCGVGSGCVGGVGWVSRFSIFRWMLLMVEMFFGVYVVVVGLLINCMSFVLIGICGLWFFM